MRRTLKGGNEKARRPGRALQEQQSSTVRIIGRRCIAPIRACWIARVYQPSFQQNIVQRFAVRRVQLVLSRFEFQQDRAGPLTIGVFGTTRG